MSDGSESMASKGGKAAAAKMTPEQRRERAQKAAQGRWMKNLPQATHMGELRIGTLVIPCAVLQGGERVLSETGFLNAIGLYRSGTVHTRAQESSADGEQLPLFVAHLNLKPFIDDDLKAVLSQPIWYRPVGKGNSQKGVSATLIPRVLDVWLRARDAGVLRSRQTVVAAQADVLMRGLAHTGIVALVDEATGYQDARERDALVKILEAFVAKELRPYVKTFKPDFYKAICELKGWPFKTSSRRTRALAHITNDLVYRRLAPGVLEELQRKNPVVKDGRRRDKHFQWLTDQKGHPELLDHVGKITGWAEMAKEAGQTYEDFLRFVNKKKPVYSGRTLFDDLPLDEDDGAC